MTRQKLSGRTLQDMIVEMSEGNPGAIRVMIDLTKEEGMDAFMSILTMDDMNMRGPMIWIGFKDFCDEDISKFIASLKARDPEMVSFINHHQGHGGEHQAVTGGASFRHT